MNDFYFILFGIFLAQLQISGSVSLSVSKASLP